MWWKKTLEVTNRGTLDPKELTTLAPLLLVPPQRNTVHPSHCMMFHFSIWLKLNPEIVKFRVVIDGGMTLAHPSHHDLRSSSLWILFEDRKDRTSFRKWLNNYKKWFTDVNPMHDNFLPKFPDNGKHTVTMVTVSTYDSSNPGYPASLIDRWLWILEHCKKPVYVMTNTGLAFVSENEAVAFKLRWDES